MLPTVAMFPRVCIYGLYRGRMGKIDLKKSNQLILNMQKNIATSPRFTRIHQMSTTPLNRSILALTAFCQI